MTHRAYEAARWLLAAVMFVGGINGFLSILPVPLPLHPVMQAWLDSGYLFVPKLLEVVGALLLCSRYRVLGLVLLWPVIVNIALFHLLLDPRQLALVPLLLGMAVLASVPHGARLAALVAADDVGARPEPYMTPGRMDQERS